MEKIIIHYDFFDDIESKIHLDKINHFKKIATDILKKYPGVIEFDYISRYMKFDLKRMDCEQILQEDILLIEKEIPSCFI